MLAVPITHDGVAALLDYLYANDNVEVTPEQLRAVVGDVNLKRGYRWVEVEAAYLGRNCPGVKLPELTFKFSMKPICVFMFLCSD